MVVRMKLRFFLPVLLFVGGLVSTAQTVPAGIHYQAVARDNTGKELADRSIDVMFSVISENPVGPVVYSELHSNVRTSSFGVFSLIVGKGEKTGGTAATFSDIRWETSSHYLKVEVKFNNDFVDMGTMPFLAVPYALYAKKSLEPGPQGPKGDPGDPASDNQKLSFDGANLSIAPNGNTVPLSSLNVPHNLTILGDTLSIYGGNKVGLPNQIQDLSYDNVKRELKLSKSSAAAIDLSELKNDADADPLNEIQTISYNPDNFQLSLSKSGGTATIGQIVAFRAGINSTVNLPHNTLVDIIFDQVAGTYYSEGGGYSNTTGLFQAPYTGVYIFSVNISLPSASSVVIKVSGISYETIIGPTSAGGTYRESLTMRLNKNDVINIAVIQTNGFAIPYSFTGYFSGYRIY
jgi:hypothetical protein